MATRIQAAPRRSPIPEDYAEWKDLLAKLEDLARGSLKESPLLTVAGAGALGFVLGGGLTVGVALRLARVGGRAALAAYVRQLLIDLISAEPDPQRSG